MCGRAGSPKVLMPFSFVFQFIEYLGVVVDVISLVTNAESHSIPFYFFFPAANSVSNYPFVSAWKVLLFVSRTSMVDSEVYTD